MFFTIKETGGSRADGHKRRKLEVERMDAEMAAAEAAKAARAAEEARAAAARGQASAIAAPGSSGAPRRRTPGTPAVTPRRFGL
jgi:hypothetical protein